MNPINWTGNPFVDTGLAVMIARAKSQGLNASMPCDLTPDVLRSVVGDGVWLAESNRRLKAYSLVLGSNSPLTNASTNPGLVSANLSLKIMVAKQKQSAIQEDIGNERGTKNREKKLLQLTNQLAKATDLLAKLEEKSSRRNLAVKTDMPAIPKTAETDGGIEEYRTVIKALLKDVLTKKYSKNVPCECTGVMPATDALSRASKLIRRSTKSKRKDFVVGRDWFPLAGSIGNDAQALPAASRTPQISALALLAAQFLPYAALLLNGQLVLFQSTEPSLVQLLVDDIYRETTAKLSAGTDKVEIRGAKAGTTPTAQLLLAHFSRLRQHQRVDSLPPHTTINLWLFSNSGTSASAEVIEVPHPALSFLWEAVRDHAKEVERLLQHERGLRPDVQLLTAMSRGRDYLPFYPYNERSPASIELFELYQKEIMARPSGMLQMARNVAARLHELTYGPSAPKDFKHLKTLMGDRRSMQKLKPQMKGLLAEWAERGDFSLNDYLSLFPCSVRPLRVAQEGWRLVWFYLNHLVEDISETPLEIGESMFVHPTLKRFAHDIFSFYEKEIGLEKFQQRILNGFRRGEIDNDRLRNWFLDLAKRGGDGYTNEAWDDLCRDENGNSVMYEVRFQLRLELANLYAQAVRGKS